LLRVSAPPPRARRPAWARGKIKLGSDTATADDELTVTAGLVSGATPPVVDGSQDVILRLQAAGSDPVSLLAPAGKFQLKGKKLTLNDADGIVIKAMRDQPKWADPDQQRAPLPPTKGGSVVIKGSKKRTTVIFKIQGVEAAKLAGSGQATLAIGEQIGERPTTFSPGKKSIKIH